MIKRALRYDVPADDLMLQVLNYTNKTAFEKDQLTFGVPEAVPDERGVPEVTYTNDYDLRRPVQGTLTKIEVKPTPKTGWTKSQWLTYRREIIQDYFISVPFVVYAVENTKDCILRLLKEQYRLYLDPHLVEVEFKKVCLQQVLFKRHMGSIVDNSNLDDYIPPISFNAVIKIKDEHPYWMGELNVYIREAVQFLDRDIKTTLQIKSYLGPGDHAKIPAEMMLRMDRYVDKDYLIKNLKVNELVGPYIVDIAKDLTADPWTFDPKPGPFNLYGTKVIYNGVNTGDVYIDDPKVTNVMILEFGEENCTNIRGQWVFGYYNQESWLNRQRIDELPLQDQ